MALCQRFLLRHGGAIEGSAEKSKSRLPVFNHNDSLFVFNTPVKTRQHWADVQPEARSRVTTRPPCIRCLEDDDTVRCEPCGHRLYCFKCLRAVSMCGSCGRKIRLDGPRSNQSCPPSELSPAITGSGARQSTHAAMDGSVVAFETREAWRAHLAEATESAATRGERRRKRAAGGSRARSSGPGPVAALNRCQSSVERSSSVHPLIASYTQQPISTPGYAQPRRACSGAEASRCGGCAAYPELRNTLLSQKALNKSRSTALRMMGERLARTKSAEELQAEIKKWGSNVPKIAKEFPKLIKPALDSVNGQPFKRVPLDAK